MPILTLQKSMRRLGRIRMGAKGTTVNKQAKTVEFPKKIETWRMTSPSQDLLGAAAVIYGGEVTEWEGSPNGRQWELFTESPVIDVIIPPGDMAFSQWFEMWSGGGCQRRCDGETEVIGGQPCMCPADPEARIEAAGKGAACKPTTRLFVIQPHLPDVGLWHFESHGFYAATELPGTINIIRTAASNGTLIPARLRIEQRTVKRDGKTNNFAVAVIELPSLTTHTLMTGEIPAELAPPVAREIERGVPDLAPGGSDAGGGHASTPQEPPVRSAHRQVMDSLNNEIRAMAAAADRPPVMAQLDIAQAKEDGATGRPLPTAGSGDGAQQRRAILNKARKLDMDGDGLDAVCRGRIGKNFDQIATVDDTNEILAALDGKPAGVLS